MSDQIQYPAAGLPEPGSPMALQSTESLELDLPLSPTRPPDGVAHTPFATPAAAPPADDMTASDMQLERSSSMFARTVQRSSLRLLAWGGNEWLQLGDGGSEDTPQPHPLPALDGKDVVCVSAGAFHSAAVTADGELYTWGCNDEGQCAIRGGAERIELPTRIEALENFNVGMAACGAAHTLAVALEGAVFGFGAAEYGQLGLGAGASSRVEHPKAVRALREARIARVAAGGRHTLALGASGVVYSFGDGSFGALGQGSTENAEAPQPLLRMWPLGVVQVAAGDSHSAGLTLDGRVFTWGRGKSGQLGLGHFENALQPTVVKSLAGVPVQQLSCGSDHSVALTHSGDVFSWGMGKWGQTGQSHTDNVCCPQRVSALEGRKVVQVSAGGRHTLFLAASSELFACGCNDNGQVGAPAGGNVNVLTPRAVQGLPAGDVVLFVAAGGDHNFAVLRSPAEGEALPAGPLSGRPHGERWLPLAPPPLLPRIAAAAAAAGEREVIKRGQDVVEAVERTFCNPAFLVHAMSARHVNSLSSSRGGGGGASIPPPSTAAGIGGGGGGGALPMDEERPRGGGASAAQPGPGAVIGGPALDIPLIAEVYQGLLRLYSPPVMAALGTACVRILDMMERYISTLHPANPAPRARPPAELDFPLLPDLAWLPPTLFILLQNPLSGDPAAYGSQIILRLGRILSATTPAEQRIPVRRALQALAAQLPPDAFATRCVRPVQRYLDQIAASGRLGSAKVEVMMAGVLLDVLRQANEAGGGKVPYSEFYNKEVSNAADLQAEYITWVRHKESAPYALVSLCQMAFLLTPEAKSRILHGEAAMQKRQHMNTAAAQALFQGLNPGAAGFLRLAVRRTHVVEDALNGLVLHADDLKKPLKVTFVSGGVAEPAQDEGGVRKEFFQLLCRDLFRPDFGMFTYNEATRAHWFSASSLENDTEYGLVGAALGLAIYNAVLLDVHFPMVVYKKLLGQEPTFADLKEAFPDLGKGLQALLDYQPAGEVEAVFCAHFEVEYDHFGEVRSQELRPGGGAIPVTGANRQEYVAAYVKWVLEESVSRQFGAFSRGFLRVAGGPALTMFLPAELELLVCGLPHLDFDGLQAAARYEGYAADSQTVAWFWEVVRAMSLEQKRKLLSFTTGSDRAPVGGLSQLPLLVQRAGPDSDKLPTSHTCFNALLLPEYSSREKMKERLLTAITNAEGFGLE